MHSQSGKLSPHEISALLRGELAAITGWIERRNPQRFALHVGVIILGAGLYGAAMGWWRDPQQAFYVAIKFPLIILLTTFGNALVNAMFAALLGLNIPFRQTDRARQICRRTGDGRFRDDEARLLCFGSCQSQKDYGRK